MKRSNTVRTLATIAAIAGLVTFLPDAAAAQVHPVSAASSDHAAASDADAPALRGEMSGIYLGPEIAFNDEVDFGIGVGLEFDLPSIDPNLSYMGDLLFFFPDGFDYLEFNTNLAYDFPLENASVVPFALGGLNVARASAEGPDDGSDTEIGLNLGGGIKFDAGSVSPRITGRFTPFSTDSFTLTFFLPFRVAN